MAKKKNRQKLRQFIRIKEIVMISLIVLSFAFLIFEHLEHFSPQQLHWLEIFEISISIIFLLEFLFELHFAKDKNKYWRHHWFYLIAAIPIPTQTFEILKGVRALRLFKLLKIFAHTRYEYNTHLFEKSR